MLPVIFACYQYERDGFLGTALGVSQILALFTDPA